MLLGNHICSAIDHGKRESGQSKKRLELLEACVRVAKEGKFWKKQKVKKKTTYQMV